MQLRLICDQIRTGSESSHVKYGAREKKRNGNNWEPCQHARSLASNQHWTFDIIYVLYLDIIYVNYVLVTEAVALRVSRRRGRRAERPPRRPAGRPRGHRRRSQSAARPGPSFPRQSPSEPPDVTPVMVTGGTRQRSLSTGMRLVTRTVTVTVTVTDSDGHDGGGGPPVSRSRTLTRTVAAAAPTQRAARSS